MLNAADRIPHVVTKQPAQRRAGENDGRIPPLLLHEPDESAELAAFLRFVDEQERVGAGAEFQAIDEHLFELGEVLAAIDERPEPRIAFEVGTACLLAGGGDGMIDQARLPDLTGTLDQKHVLVPFPTADKRSESGLESSRNV